MKNIWKWLIVMGAVITGILLVLVPAAFRFGVVPGLTRYGTGMYTYGHHSMMGYLPFGFFGGGLMMAGMFLIPALLVGLAVFGLVSLVRRQPERSGDDESETVVCGGCGETLQEAWVACPYCGESRCES